jgi:hypothetical protein
MLRPMKLPSLVAFAAWSVAFAACTGGAGPTNDAVGKPCKADTECVQRCIGTSEFGGGMCTISCTESGDCPAGGVCLKEGGGVCGVACGAATDCTDFGDGWTCADADGKDGTKAQVCQKK